MLDWIEKGLIPLLVSIIGTSGTLYVAHMPAKRNDKATLRKLKALLRVVYRSLDIVSFGPDPSLDVWLAASESQFTEFIFAADTTHGLTDNLTNLLYELAYWLRSSVKAMNESAADVSLDDFQDESDASELSERAARFIKMKLDLQVRTIELAKVHAKVQVDRSWRLAVTSLHLLREDDFLRQVTLDMHRDTLEYVLVNGMSGRLPRTPTDNIGALRDTLDLTQNTGLEESAEGTGT